jgi:alanine racemase
MKADADGLGAVPLAKALRDAGADRFGAAELNEALDLLPIGRPIQILGGILPDEISPAIEHGIVLPITDEPTARRISDAAVQQHKTAVCHLLVDTGMGRLGILADEAETLAELCRTLPGIRLEGIYSHFPVAYRSGEAYTTAQIQTFIRLLNRLKEKGLSFDWRHIANSDAVNNFPETFRAPFNAVRTGINLHGSFDTEGRRTLDLQPVLTLKTVLTSVRKLPAGMSIGYGRTYTLPRETRVGTVSAGYADGLPLALSNRGFVLIRNRPCPILGRVSMDYTTVSLEQVPEAECGDDVICLGGTGPSAISVEDWAQLKGTHPYDIICSFGRRVERRYLDPIRKG